MTETKQKFNLQTPKFSVNYKVEIDFPKDLDVNIDSRRIKYNGHQFNVSYKAQKINQKQQTDKIVTAEERLLQKQATSEVKQQIIRPENREFNKTSAKKTKILTNIKEERRANSENEVLMKIAKQVVKSQQEKAFAKQEAMQKKEKFILNQIEAKKRRQELKQSKKQQLKQQAEKK